MRGISKIAAYTRRKDNFSRENFSLQHLITYHLVIAGCPLKSCKKIDFPDIFV